MSKHAELIHTIEHLLVVVDTLNPIADRDTYSDIDWNALDYLTSEARLTLVAHQQEQEEPELCSCLDPRHAGDDPDCPVHGGS